VLIAYGFMALPLAVAGLPLAFHVPPLYTQELGLDLAAVGLVLMVARVTDVLTDPVTGLLSDRLRTRWGRRRPWIVAGTPLMMLGTWQLFVPAGGVTIWYLLGWVSVLYLGWTFVAIPYGAWGAELSADYHERSRLTGSREMCTILGQIAAAVVPAAAAGPGGQLAPGLRALATGSVVLLPLAALLLMLVVREPPPTTSAPTLALRDGLARAWRNDPFRRLLVSSVLAGFAVAFNSALAVLFYLHVLRLGEATAWMVLVYFVAGTLAVPFWVAMSKRRSKHRTLVLGACWGCGWFLMAPFLPPGQVLPVLIMNFMTGLSMSVGPTLGASMAADTIDVDILETGENRAALFISLWSMGTKLALALGVGAALSLLDLSGFHPAGPNGPAELFALTTLYCLVPICLWLASVWPIWNFPITPARPRLLREAIGRRAAAS
jgi:Na+/melibiose symporter-like transporter